MSIQRGHIPRHKVAGHDYDNLEQKTGTGGDIFSRARSSGMGIPIQSTMDNKMGTNEGMGRDAETISFEVVGGESVDGTPFLMKGLPMFKYHSPIPRLERSPHIIMANIIAVNKMLAGHSSTCGTIRNREMAMLKTAADVIRAFTFFGYVETADPSLNTSGPCKALTTTFDIRRDAHPATNLWCMSDASGITTGLPIGCNTHTYVAFALNFTKNQCCRRDAKLPKYMYTTKKKKKTEAKTGKTYPKKPRPDNHSSSSSSTSSSTPANYLEDDPVDVPVLENLFGGEPHPSFSYSSSSSSSFSSSSEHSDLFHNESALNDEVELLGLDFHSHASSSSLASPSNSSASSSSSSSMSSQPQVPRRDEVKEKEVKQSIEQLAAMSEKTSGSKGPVDPSSASLHGKKKENCGNDSDNEGEEEDEYEDDDNYNNIKLPNGEHWYFEPVAGYTPSQLGSISRGPYKRYVIPVGSIREFYAGQLKFGQSYICQVLGMPFWRKEDIDAMGMESWRQPQEIICLPHVHVCIGGLSNWRNIVTVKRSKKKKRVFDDDRHETKLQIIVI